MEEQQAKTEPVRMLILKFAEVRRIIIDTQALRRRLIESLQELYELARKWAANDERTVRLAAYIAQVTNSLSKSYDEVRFNEQMKELEELKAKNEGKGLECGPFRK